MSLRSSGAMAADGHTLHKALAGVLAVLAVILFWLAAYFSGLCPWLGYAWLSRSSFGIGPVAIIGENQSGTDVGFDDFLFFEGQEIVIDYEVDIRAGSLWFHVFQPFDGKLGGGAMHYVTESGSGTWTMPVRDTAIYHITVEGSPTRGPGRGWDLDYKVWWGARWAE